MNKKEVKKAPALRFKGFTNDWEQRKLGDYGSVAMNKRIFKNQTNTNSGVPFYKIGTFGKKADAFISKKLFEEYRKKYPYPKKGDLLISASGSIGRVIEYTGQQAYYQDSNIVWLNHNDNLENIYLKAYYQIIHWSGIEGSTIKRLYNKNILNTKIYVPIKDEQFKVGTIIDQIEKLITLQQRKVTLFKQLKGSLLDSLISGKDTPLVRFNEFKSKWTLFTLKDIVTKTIKGSAKAEMHGKESIYLDTHYLNGGNPSMVNSPTNVSSNDIIILWDGSQAGKVYHGFTGALGSTLKSYTPKYSSDYLFQYLKKYQNKIFANYRTPNIPHVIKDFATVFKVNLPSTKEQIIISSLLKTLDVQITTENTSVNHLKNIKQFLLQNMFI
ncbi:restriction endonuclease subunit S [Lactobacillus johnsonii]|uniref:restriction endonuclease subunit S n=2 Tax=Lactobacillus TaxID=1578 RepID=UPI000BA39003|nr:restriction endonuclease subunit S [Lactobacillus johnsonii]PAB56383.1 restriction endonuclease subunit S [Lactobacillus johnsonii]